MGTSMMVYCYIAIVYGKTQGYMQATLDILCIPTSLAFLPYNVTAHSLVLILFLCYVVALITVLDLVIDIVVQLINS